MSKSKLRAAAGSENSAPTRQLISTTKAAQRLNVSPGTVRKFIAEGRLRGYAIAGTRLLKVDSTEVDGLIITIDNS